MLPFWRKVATIPPYDTHATNRGSRTLSDFWQHIPATLREHEDSIELLAAKDNEFRELCEDYEDCVAALRHWEASGEPEAENRVKEYRELLAALQTEIELFLKSEILRTVKGKEDST